MVRPGPIPCLNLLMPQQHHKSRDDKMLLMQFSRRKQGSTGWYLFLLLLSLSLGSGSLLLSPLLDGVFHVQELVPCDQTHCGVLECLLVQLQMQSLLKIANIRSR